MPFKKGESHSATKNNDSAKKKTAKEPEQAP